MRKIIILLILLTFILAIIGPGCYTVILHPKNERDYRADQTSDCIRCHVDYGEYPYGYYYSPDPNYWWDHDIYVQYYANPWWWDYYDYPGYGGAPQRSTKFESTDDGFAPPPPPYITGEDNFPITPTLLNLPVQPGSTGNNTTGQQARPEADGNSTETRSKEPASSGNSTKSTRSSTPQTNPDEGNRPQPEPVRPEPKDPESQENKQPASNE